MPNQNTIVNALRAAGEVENQPIQLTNPGGNNPWLFVWPAGVGVGGPNAGQPVALEVPTVAANGIELGPLAGHNESTNNLWYADSNMFLVRAQGRVAPNNYNKTLKLYLFTGNGLQNAGAGAGALQDFQIGFGSATLPAQATNDAYSNWYLEAKCLWDSQSLTMTGEFQGQIAGSLITRAAFSVYNPSAFVAQQAAGAYLPIAFVVGANISSSAAAGNDVVALEEFVAEQI